MTLAVPAVLLAWIGLTDIKASEGDPSVGLGPIAQAAANRSFDEIVLLSDHPKARTKKYTDWLSARTSSAISVRLADLSGPTEFGEIYPFAVAAVEDVVSGNGPHASLVFHLSPGTPAMAAIWIILAKTRFPAELIESSAKGGVRTASVPFDISADFIPDLLRKPDDELMRLVQGLPPEAPEFGEIIHRCAAMKRVVARARRVAPRSLPVLIQGESGTGKELLARAIHHASPRASGPFIEVNCGAIPRELVEAEFFGFKRGAFTGASTDHPGYFEAASGGTLFLDEIGELPLEAQVKLLRVIQQSTVTRVGETKGRSINVRLVSATNRKLIEEVHGHRFREDLFHRIAVAIIGLPPLREREGDLGLLIDRLLVQVNRESAGQPGHEDKQLSARAKKLLIHQPWPGNVRELLNTLQRAVIWSSAPIIDESEIREALLQVPVRDGQQILDRPFENGFDIEDLLAGVARHYLSRAFDEAHGNKTVAADLVGLRSYQTFTNWMRRYQVGESVARGVLPNRKRSAR